MKVFGHLNPDMRKIPESIKALEEMGFDSAGSAEMSHDPFFPLLLAAEHSEKIGLHTGIAVAFARTPMILANLGHDLNAYSRGRFTMGLGSQIRAHVTKRFSMPWGSPAAQMRELVLAMHAIWDNWYEGKPLEFTGKYYTHTLMTPAFTPTDIKYGRPKVTLAAVGPKMTEVAGEVADGIIVHPFSNEKYIREVTLPALEKGLNRAGRRREDIEVIYSPFIISGNNEEKMATSRQEARNRISFYASTPAYKGVLDIHGWGELQPELNKMSKQGRWNEMGELVTDEMLNTFGIVGEPASLVTEMKTRFGDIVDSTSGNLPSADQDTHRQMIAALRA
jgi:probable F420-dependent oxidoreductase